MSAALAATVTGCSSAGDGDVAADTESRSPGGSEASEGDGEGRDAEATAVDDAGTAPEGDGGGGGDEATVLGTARARLEAVRSGDPTIPLRLDVTRLERGDHLIELTMVLTNEAEGDEENPRFRAGQLFGGPGHEDISSVGLVDAGDQKVYLPVFDSEGDCLCSDGLISVDLSPGSSYVLVASFGGVPDDVEELDVHMPEFPAITGVPVR